MPIIEPLSKDEISSPKLVKYLEMAEELQVPGPEFLRVLAHAPNFAEAFFDAMRLALFQGRVDHKLKELIRIQLARKAGDAYFAGLRSKQAQDEGLTEELIEAACAEGFADDDRFTDAEKWALHYGYWMYRAPKTLDAAFYDKGRKYFDDAQIMELGGMIAVYYGMAVMMASFRFEA
ncbi:MAG: carboxymuconolactone decarboxylase family protein [Alphaproteobacteria bacterium]|nr:carboxymuconolactone decarboxylase family protein [Alphaproteobacteria bacterium]